MVDRNLRSATLGLWDKISPFVNFLTNFESLITINSLDPTQNDEMYGEYLGKLNANDVGSLPKLNKHPTIGKPIGP